MKTLLLSMFLSTVCVSNAANYLTFTAEIDDSKFGIENHQTNNPDVQYSLDGGITWNQLEDKKMILLEHKGDKALIKGNNPESFSTKKQYTNFLLEGSIAATGSVMSLIDGEGNSTKIPNNGCFSRLFFSCSNLTHAPELPATELTNSCYAEMFALCLNLTQAPNLPATVMADSCYYLMFYYCKNITQAPELPATELSEMCYSNMLQGCTSITTAPALPSTKLAKQCYYHLFADCSSLQEAPELPATELAEMCYGNMFIECTSLEKAPKLPAVKLANSCYSSMFSKCTNLKEATELPATVMADRCYSQMFSGCTNMAQAPELPSLNLASYCYSGMFHGCTSLATAPQLPATNLSDYCYFGMFEKCTSLKEAPELPSTQSEFQCYCYMFSGCSSLTKIKVNFSSWFLMPVTNWAEGVSPSGVFVCPEELAEVYGPSNIPEGWKKIGSESGVDEIESGRSWSVSTSGLTIFIYDAKSKVEIYDIAGRIVSTKQNDGSDLQFTLANKGVYFVKIGSQSQKVEL